MVRIDTAGKAADLRAQAEHRANRKLKAPTSNLMKSSTLKQRDARGSN